MYQRKLKKCKCVVCGKEFESIYAKVKTCCKKCQKEWMSKLFNKQVTVFCAICGKPKKVQQSKYDPNKKYYCCLEHKYMGDRNENIKTAICYNCGKKFRVYDEYSRVIDGEKKYFCTKRCMAQKAGKNEYILHEDYAEVILNKGIALIDLEDVEKCKPYQWFVYTCVDDNTRQYALGSMIVNGKKTDIKMHRFLTNCPEGLVVDHANHNPLDNRKQNLKICTNAENLENRKGATKANKTGYRNVYRASGTNKYRVQIAQNRKIFTPKRLFDTPEEANEVAIKMRNEIFTNNVLDRLDEDSQGA